jgi:hypothetical protein
MGKESVRMPSGRSKTWLLEIRTLGDHQKSFLTTLTQQKTDEFR